MTSELGKPLTPAQIKAIYDAHVKPLPKVYAVPKGTPMFHEMLREVFVEYPLDYDDYHAELIRRAQHMVDHVLANRGNRLTAGNVFQFAAGPPNTFKTTVIGLGMPMYAIGRNRNVRGITLSEDRDLASPSVDKMRNIMLHNEAYTRMFGVMKFEKTKKSELHKWTEHAFTVTGRTEQHEEPTWSSVGYRSFPAKHHYDFFLGDDPHAETSQRIKDKVWETTKQIPARMEPWGGFFGIANFWRGMDWSFRMLNEWGQRMTDEPYIRALSDGTLTEDKLVKSLIPAYWTDAGATKKRDELFAEGSADIWAYQYMLDRTQAGDQLFNPSLWESSLALIGNDPGQVRLDDLGQRIAVLDPASGGESETSSEMALHVGAWRKRGTYFWLDSKSGRWKRPQLMDALEIVVREWQPRVLLVEKVLLSDYLEECIRVRLGELRVAGYVVPRIVSVHHNGRSKDDRICGWLEYWNRGYVQINGNMDELSKVREQLITFPKCARNIKDILDAWAYALTGSRQEGLIPMMQDIRAKFDVDGSDAERKLLTFIQLIKDGKDPDLHTERTTTLEDYVCR